MCQDVPQQQLVQDLRRAANLPDEEGPVEFTSTHCSWVFLTADSVYKVKRSKNYGFLDYSTLAKREHYCREEVRLNRRTAPDVYLGVLPVRRDAHGYSLNRGGAVADWAVHMRRLPDDRSALVLARGNALRHEDLDEIARTVARFHRAHEVERSSAETLRRHIEENFEQARGFVGRWIDSSTFDHCRRLQLQWWERSRPMLEARPAVDGHGDLRLEHVYLLGPGPTPIDCIEFTDRFRIGDPALDFAFLVMDLMREHHSDLAEYVLGRYAYERDDYDLFPIIDGYLSYRAWVRGKVACFVADDVRSPRDTVRRKAREAREFALLARACLTETVGAPTLIGVGGLVASGKTTVSQAIARRYGLAVVSADATRKSLAGLEHEAPGGAALYTDAFTAATQAELLRRAGAVLASGRSVVVDTTFRTRALRDRARSLADQHGADFLFVECSVPEAMARARLRGRTAGVSDAREELFERIRSEFEAADELAPSQHVVIDTAGPIADAVGALPLRRTEARCPRI
jgi:aminoglycoside phosphotransferase family enzyme/predicted kinase